MTETDIKLLREAFAVAQRAQAHGNHPFGAVLVNESSEIILEGENTVITGRDCTGAIFWSGISRLVFGLSKKRLNEMVDQTVHPQLMIECREIFAAGQRPVIVEGPALEDEAARIHKNF